MNAHKLLRRYLELCRIVEDGEMARSERTILEPAIREALSGLEGKGLGITLRLGGFHARISAIVRGGLPVPCVPSPIDPS